MGCFIKRTNESANYVIKMPLYDFLYVYVTDITRYKQLNQYVMAQFTYKYICVHIIYIICMIEMD